MANTFNDTLEQIRVVRLELHEELMKIPQYKALTALDDLLRIIEKATIEPPAIVPPKIVTAPEPPKPLPENAPQPSVAVKIPVMPEDAPQPVVEFRKKPAKPLTQVQALLQVLRNKETPASIGWLTAEIELLGVRVGGVSPRKTLGVALSSNKDLFRRVEFDGGRWMWGLKDRKYPGETTYNHLPPTEFKSMRVRKSVQ
jgi:hypothetical protein